MGLELLGGDVMKVWIPNRVAIPHGGLRTDYYIVIEKLSKDVTIPPSGLGTNSPRTARTLNS